MENPLRPNLQRAQYSLICFAVLIGLAVVACIGYVVELISLYNYKNGKPALFSGEQVAQFFQIILYSAMAATVVNIVLFISWFRRAYYNLRLAGRPTLFTDGWAAGSWFVPIINLARPYQIMKEIWEDTQAATPNQVTITPSTLVGIWWGVRLADIFTSRIINSIYKYSSNLEEIIVANWLYFGMTCLSIVSAIITVVMIKKTSAIETRLRQSIEQREPSEDLLGFVA